MLSCGDARDEPAKCADDQPHLLVPLLVVVLLTNFDGRNIAGVPTELVGAAIFGSRQSPTA